MSGNFARQVFLFFEPGNFDFFKDIQISFKNKLWYIKTFLAFQKIKTARQLCNKIEAETHITARKQVRLREA